MEPQLKQLFDDEAARAGDPSIHYPDVRRLGRARRKRRRLAGTLTASAAVVLLGLGAVTLGPALTSQQPSPAGSVSKFADRLPTYANATGIHYGAKTLNTNGSAPVALAQTDQGFVYTDSAGKIYLTDGGKVRQIGDHDTSQRLTVDDSGSYVGWADSGGKSSTAAPQFVVYDTSAMKEILRLDNPGGTPQGGPAKPGDEPRVAAIDGDTVYLRDNSITYQVNLQTGEKTTIIGQDAGYLLQDVASGTYSVEQDKETFDARIGVTTDLNRIGRWLDGSETDLSPSGRYLFLNWADRPARPGPAGLIDIVDTRTGQRVTVNHPQLHLTLAQWLDDDRFTALGNDWDTLSASDPGPKPVDLLQCRISTGDCEIVQKAVTTSQFDESRDPGFAVPNGRRITDQGL